MNVDAILLAVFNIFIILFVLVLIFVLVFVFLFFFILFAFLLNDWQQLCQLALEFLLHAFDLFLLPQFLNQFFLIHFTVLLNVLDANIDSSNFAVLVELGFN